MAAKSEKFDQRYQVLLALFPGYENDFLLKKSNEYPCNEIGTLEFNTWIDNNKKAVCGVCYDEDCIESKMLSCPKGHQFCKECVERGSKVAIGDGKTSLECLSGQCTEQFEITTLAKALSTSLSSKWISKIQAAEVQKASIEGLVQCPFCTFAMILETTPEEQLTFSCQHPDCQKFSCRKCNEESHIPLCCDEVEKDAEVEKRTFIENKMTEAMIRVCYRCKKPFIKQDGCNKMKCECGGTMCYLCRKPITNYDHFVGEGGTPNPPHQVCPLWSNNEELHASEVATVAIEAKRVANVERPNVKLKIDPTIRLNPDAHDDYDDENWDTVSEESVINDEVNPNGNLEESDTSDEEQPDSDDELDSDDESVNIEEEDDENIEYEFQLEQETDDENVSSADDDLDDVDDNEDSDEALEGVQGHEYDEEESDDSSYDENIITYTFPILTAIVKTLQQL